MTATVYYVRLREADGSERYVGPILGSAAAYARRAELGGVVVRRDPDPAGPCIVCGAYDGDHDPGCMDRGPVARG